MFIYSVSYTSYEDSSVIYLSHEKEYTEEEFEKIVIDAITWYMKALKTNSAELANETIDGPMPFSPANLGRWLGSRVDREWPCIWNISDLFPDVGYVLERPEFGFKVVKPKQEVVFFGWQNPFSYKTDWVKNAHAEECATTRLSENLWANGFTEKDGGSYESNKKHEDIADKHETNGLTCPNCNAQTRDNPIGCSPGRAITANSKTRCWWCPTCGDGCGCTYGEKEFDPDDEVDREDFYGL
jgi:hypothetical protein